MNLCIFAFHQNTGKLMKKQQDLSLIFCQRFIMIIKFFVLIMASNLINKNCKLRKMSYLQEGKVV